MPEASRAAYSAAQAMRRTLADPCAVASIKCHILRVGERTAGGGFIVEAC